MSARALCEIRAADSALDSPALLSVQLERSSLEGADGDELVVELGALMNHE